MKKQKSTLDQLLGKFKRDSKETVILCKSKAFYEKPSEIKKRKIQAAKRRTRIEQQRDELT